jgi:predicted molibdopterin-dependent oxidoreductase YjgC
MSTVTKKSCNIKINDTDLSVPEGTVILEACNQNEVQVSNLCYNRKLKPFAACRTCMVETVVDGKKELVYSCTQPVCDGMEVKTGTEETDRYNKACLEMSSILWTAPYVTSREFVPYRTTQIYYRCSMGDLRFKGGTNPVSKPTQ